MVKIIRRKDISISHLRRAKRSIKFGKAKKKIKTKVCPDKYEKFSYEVILNHNHNMSHVIETMKIMLSGYKIINGAARGGKRKSNTRLYLKSETDIMIFKMAYA